MKNNTTTGKSNGEEVYKIGQIFADKIQNPKKVIKWCKKEIAQYQKLIDVLEKQIAFEESLPKLSKKRRELPRRMARDIKILK